MTAGDTIKPVEPIEPIRLSFEVACPPEKAFRTWTERIATWWPADHTVTGEGDLLVVLEPRVGGRLFERTRGGDEHDWGRVTVWEPPRRLGYTWHLRADRRRRDRRRGTASSRPAAARASRSSIVAGSVWAPSPDVTGATGTSAVGERSCRTTAGRSRAVCNLYVNVKVR